jgi:hypothetical protein
MAEDLASYEQRKRALLEGKGMSRPRVNYDELIHDSLETPRQVDAVDILSVGGKVLIGGGVGLLAGVATIATVASAGEVILAGAVTKVAGVVGGALGLNWGLRSLKNKRRL